MNFHHTNNEVYAIPATFQSAGLAHFEDERRVTLHVLLDGEEQEGALAFTIEDAVRIRKALGILLEAHNHGAN